MSRIDQLFARLATARRTALITYMTAGDPAPDATVELMHALVAGGADALELGVPFSDPMADGPVIQRATERALAHGVTLADVLDMVSRFRERDSSTPVILMGYLNPVEVLGYAAFAERAQRAGVDGVLLVDLPPEEGIGLVAPLRAQGIDLISLLAPTSDDARIGAIARFASGFVYYVSIKGVTGAASLETTTLNARLNAIRSQLSLPVGVGFGIRDAKTAAQVAECADAVIVGSAIVERIEALAQTPERMSAVITAFAAELRAALDQTDGSRYG